MIDHCISSLFANFEMSRGRRSLKYDSFRTFERDNLFQVSVCRPLRPNRDLNHLLPESRPTLSLQS